MQETLKNDLSKVEYSTPYVVGQKLNISYGKMQLPDFLTDFIKKENPEVKKEEEIKETSQQKWRRKNKDKLRLYYQKKYQENKKNKYAKEDQKIIKEIKKVIKDIKDKDVN